MKSLDQIGVERGTDKSSLNHCYLSFYELLFEKWRFKPIRILEIGVQFGNSIRTWKEYFPNAEVVGIDSVDNGVQLPGILIANAYEPDAQERILGNFDIIIDDGSHLEEHQRYFVFAYQQRLYNEGILIVEDETLVAMGLFSGPE